MTNGCAVILPLSGRMSTGIAPGKKGLNLALLRY
jgi:hypothetical protein